MSILITGAVAVAVAGPATSTKNIPNKSLAKPPKKLPRHRKSGSSVVSHKTKKKIVSEKERGEEKQYADVVGGVTDRVVIGAEYGGNLF